MGRSQFFAILVFYITLVSVSGKPCFFTIFDYCDYDYGSDSTEQEDENLELFGVDLKPLIDIFSYWFWDSSEEETELQNTTTISPMTPGLQASSTTVSSATDKPTTMAQATDKPTTAAPGDGKQTTVVPKGEATTATPKAGEQTTVRPTTVTATPAADTSTTVP